MSIVSDSYESHWRNYRTTGPVDWRSPHHGQPDPQFVALCREAEARGMFVCLYVGKRLFGLHPNQFRLVETISIRATGRIATLVRVGVGVEETLARAAARTRLLLEAA